MTSRVTMEEFVRRVDAAVAGGAVAIAVCDLDDFAAVNDRLGHAVGDTVIAAFERTLHGSLPKDACVARIGGDEWMVGLPDASAESALIVLEEIRSHYADHPVPGVDRHLNASVGIAARPPHAAGTMDVAHAAGSALMRAKRDGRGRCAIYIEEKMVLKSSYYPRAALDRLAKVSSRSGRTEASLLREALDDLLAKHREDQ